MKLSVSPPVYPCMTATEWIQYTDSSIISLFLYAATNFLRFSPANFWVHLCIFAWCTHMSLFLSVWRLNLTKSHSNMILFFLKFTTRRVSSQYSVVPNSFQTRSKSHIFSLRMELPFRFSLNFSECRAHYNVKLHFLFLCIEVSPEGNRCEWAWHS